MYEIKEEYKKNNTNNIKIDIDDILYVIIDTEDNSNMNYKTFKTLCDNGYTFLFDLSKRIKNDVIFNI